MNVEGGREACRQGVRGEERDGRKSIDNESESEREAMRVRESKSEGRERGMREGLGG